MRSIIHGRLDVTSAAVERHVVYCFTTPCGASSELSLHQETLAEELGVSRRAAEAVSISRPSPDWRRFTVSSAPSKLHGSVQQVAIGFLFAFLAGGVVLNVLKEELLEERQSRYWPFLAGAAGYSLLLLAA